MTPLLTLFWLAGLAGAVVWTIDVTPRIWRHADRSAAIFFALCVAELVCRATFKLIAIYRGF
jgi:hypothetical protein